MTADPGLLAAVADEVLAARDRVAEERHRTPEAQRREAGARAKAEWFATKPSELGLDPAHDRLI
ncbi:MAG TPA: hypothetical protein VH092_10985 [Urbifossiella sp.]|nr:hypothetical protein [Urbifossiella sp.]